MTNEDSTDDIALAIIDMLAQVTITDDEVTVPEDLAASFNDRAMELGALQAHVSTNDDGAIKITMDSGLLTAAMVRLLASLIAGHAAEIDGTWQDVLDDLRDGIVNPD